jgi:hypothetical protein
MIITEIINNVIAGGLLGSLGQGVRLAVGLKKLNAENSKKENEGEDKEPISSGRLILSIFIGFIAGAIGMLIKGSTLAPNGNYNSESIVTIIAIGYSGADFIEGVFNTYLTKFNPAASPTSTQTTEITAKTTTTAATVPVPQNTAIDNSDEDIVG